MRAELRLKGAMWMSRPRYDPLVNQPVVFCVVHFLSTVTPCRVCCWFCFAVWKALAHSCMHGYHDGLLSTAFSWLLNMVICCVYHLHVVLARHSYVETLSIPYLRSATNVPGVSGMSCQASTTMQIFFQRCFSETTQVNVASYVEPAPTSVIVSVACLLR